MLAKRMNYLSNIKTGCYAVKNGMTMIELIRILRAGMQTPVNLTFNNIRTKTDLVSRLSQQLMLDSVSLMNALNDLKKVEKFGFDTCTVVCMFIPNTYEVYWDIGVDKLLSRMKREYDIFWNAERKAKAQKIGLTPVEVSILASIVEEEATYPDEYPVIAGLYLNRLHKGMKLEADPTVKFCRWRLSLQRILFKHLEWTRLIIHINMPDYRRDPFVYPLSKPLMLFFHLNSMVICLCAPKTIFPGDIILRLHIQNMHAMQYAISVHSMKEKSTKK